MDDDDSAIGSRELTELTERLKQLQSATLQLAESAALAQGRLTQLQAKLSAAEDSSMVDAETGCPTMVKFFRNLGNVGRLADGLGMLLAQCNE